MFFNNSSVQVSLLSVINGQNGQQKGSKLIKSITNAIIQPESQYKFSWTGKPLLMDGRKSKIAFVEYKHIIGTIHATCRHVDSMYSLKACERDLTYRVFKNANSKR